MLHRSKPNRVVGSLTSQNNDRSGLVFIDLEVSSVSNEIFIHNINIPLFFTIAQQTENIKSFIITYKYDKYLL